MRGALLLLLGALVQAETPKLPEPYQSLVELTHATPPEFAADALLRIADSHRIPNRESKRGLIEEAFRLGAVASRQVKMRGFVNLPDTRPGRLREAYALNLDALSLQSRAVMDMLPLDADKAQKLFLEISPPRLAPLSCDDALIYDVADFYRAMAAVAGTFPAKDRANFLLSYLSGVTSPAQLAPMASAIKNASVTPQQREVLWTNFAGILESLQPDARSFTASLNELGNEATPLIQHSFEKYRSQGKSCGDDALKPERYWQSAEAQRLLEDGKKLRSTAAGNSDEWQLQLADYLNALAGWGPGKENSEPDYFHQKSIVYLALVELIPRGPQRDRTLDGFLGFLTGSSLYQQSPVEWFMEARAMLERVRHSNDGEPGKVLDAFERSGNPVLVLQVALERVLGPKEPAGIPTSN